MCFTRCVYLTQSLRHKNCIWSGSGGLEVWVWVFAAAWEPSHGEEVTWKLGSIVNQTRMTAATSNPRSQTSSSKYTARVNAAEPKIKLWTFYLKQSVIAHHNWIKRCLHYERQIWGVVGFATSKRTIFNWIYSSIRRSRSVTSNAE